jgi:hypothetical protein
MSDRASARGNQAAGVPGPLQVQAHWDATVGVCWAESDDLPGLATEAPSFPELIAHIKSLAPTIIVENLGREPGGLFVRVAGDASDETFRVDG